VIVKGRIDQINSLGRNDVEIVDYKTGKPRRTPRQEGLQLSIYAIAVKEILELNPVRLVFHYCRIMSGRKRRGTRSSWRKRRR